MRLVMSKWEEGLLPQCRMQSMKQSGNQASHNKKQISESFIKNENNLFAFTPLSFILSRSAAISL